MLKTPKTKAGRFIRETLIVLTSAFFGSSVQIFVMIPNGMTSGGMPGIARLITHFLPVSYSLVYYTLSMVVLVIAWITMGKGEVKRIISLAFAYPIMLFIFERIDCRHADLRPGVIDDVALVVLHGQIVDRGRPMVIVVERDRSHVVCAIRECHV